MLLTISKTDSLARRPLCGNATNKTRLNAIAMLMTDVVRPATTASWPTNAITRIVPWGQNYAAIAPSPSSSVVPRETAMTMESRSRTLPIVGMEYGR